MENLKNNLKDLGYYIPDQIASAIEAALAIRPVAGAFLFGSAGTGKTALAEAVGKAMNKEIFFFQCFPGTREDDLLVKLLPDDSTVSGVKAHDGVLLQAAKASQEKAVCLILDEWDKTRPSADSFLLDFLQNGRINYNGRSSQARLSNMVIFITMNDERELSEPLLRRLPVIHFHHLPTSIVRQALEATHAGHPYINACLNLYEKTLLAGMSKPATIQELRQLLDAITALGNRADWNSLVFQFVTKTKENHELLARVQYERDNDKNDENSTLDADAFSEDIDISNEEKQADPRMPRIRELKSFNTAIKKEDIPAPENTTGVVRISDEVYDILAAQTDLTPEGMEKIMKVSGEYIYITKRFSWGDWENIPWDCEGEVLIEHINEHFFTKENIFQLRKLGWKIVKVEDEIYLKHENGLEMRWTNKTTEIITTLNVNDFRNAFGLYNDFSPKDVSKDIFYLPKKKEEKKIEPIPALYLCDDDTVHERFDKITTYIVSLHEYFFKKGEGDIYADVYDILKIPEKYDINGWRKRKDNLEKLKMFLEVLEEHRDYVIIDEIKYHYVSIHKTHHGIVYGWGHEYKEFISSSSMLEFVTKKIKEAKSHLEWLNSSIRGG